MKNDASNEKKALEEIRSLIKEYAPRPHFVNQKHLESIIANEPFSEVKADFVMDEWVIGHITEILNKTVYYDLLADVVEVEEEQEPCEDAISRDEDITRTLVKAYRKGYYDALERNNRMKDFVSQTGSEDKE